VASTLALAPRRIELRHVLVAGGAVATLLPWVSPGVALCAGITVALIWGNPFPVEARAVTQRLLTWSVVGLGAGMNLGVVARVGLQGFGVAAISIGSAIALGTLLGRLFGVSRPASLLVTVGTAICGGSAIAAASPAIGAKDEDVSVALVTVFVLNAVALFLFPAVGRALDLDATRFGLWCALAIHDTSSVVGAATGYGGRALEVATAAKLARALWIVPVTFGLSLYRARTASAAERAVPQAPPKRPLFIAGFLASAAVVTLVPALQPVGHVVSVLAHRGLALTLFAIGLGLTRSALHKVGAKPLVQGLVLWAALAGGTLFAITRGWVD